MQVIFRTVYGSRLFGTHNENSDTDFKQIHKENLRNIVLRKDKDNQTHNSNPKGKNGKDDVDDDSKELRTYINQCLSGQPYAIEMLFARKECIVSTSSVWESIQEHREKLVTKNIDGFVGFARRQTKKYSDKGIKLDELISLRDYMTNKDLSLDLGEVINGFDFTDKKFLKVYKKFNSSSQKMDDMMEMADSDHPLNRKALLVYKSIDDKINNFGVRVQLSRNSNGCDYKAFYHALRVCWELEELLLSSEIKFPSTKVPFLMKVRNKEFEREYLEKYLSDEINRVLMLPNMLPEADNDFWQEWIVEEYLGKV
jgi:predicted nucleotidyltransferase